jgi:hypothetical protein
MVYPEDVGRRDVAGRFRRYVGSVESQGDRMCPKVSPPPPVFPGEGWGGGRAREELRVPKTPSQPSPVFPGEVKESGGAEHAIALRRQRPADKFVRADGVICVECRDWLRGAGGAGISERVTSDAERK